MAKDWKKNQAAAAEQEPEEKQEMTLAEAKAWRSGLTPKGKKVLTEQEKREAFRLFWASEKYKYGKGKDLESILWLHIKASKLDQPEQFEQGLAHFGLKKIRN